MTDGPQTCDVLCIGSSPLVLLEALHQQRKGRRVVVVDAGERLGGAWKECEVFGLKRVEIAPHIMMFNRATYDYFAQELGVRMERMSPPPRYVVNTRLGQYWIPYALSPFVAYITVPLHYLTNPQFRVNFAYIKEEYFGRLGDALRQIGHWIFSRRKPHVEYPSGGTVELLDCIETQLRQAGTVIHLNTRVQSLDKMSSGQIKVRLNSGDYLAGHICMTRHQHVPEFRANDTLLEAKYDHARYTSLHFQIRTNHQLRAAFALVKRDPILNLLSDLTSYMPDVPAGRRVVVVRLAHWDAPFDAAGAEKVFTHLITHGYLPEDAGMENFHFNAYDQGRLGPTALAEVEGAFGNALSIFRTTNFSNSIGDRVPQWRASL